MDSLYDNMAKLEGFFMKLVQLIRYLFQVMVLVAVFCLIGSIGAWETGSINFPQLLLQLILFSGCALFASHLSHQRFFIRVRRRRPVRRFVQSRIPRAAVSPPPIRSEVVSCTPSHPFQIEWRRIFFFGGAAFLHKSL